MAAEESVQGMPETVLRSPNSILNTRGRAMKPFHICYSLLASYFGPTDDTIQRKRPKVSQHPRLPAQKVYAYTQPRTARRTNIHPPLTRQLRPYPPFDGVGGERRGREGAAFSNQRWRRPRRRRGMGLGGKQEELRTHESREQGSNLGPLQIEIVSRSDLPRRPRSTERRGLLQS